MTDRQRPIDRQLLTDNQRPTDQQQQTGRQQLADNRRPTGNQQQDKQLLTDRLRPAFPNQEEPLPAGTATHTCPNCRRTLPLSEFYRIGSDRHTDRYCKECRRGFSRRQRKDPTPEGPDPATPRRQRPRLQQSLTDVRDRKQRIALIIKAKQTVHESILRRRRRDAEAAYRAEGRLR